MSTELLTFAEAFDADLKTYGREQSEICALLTEPGEPVITTAAISNWKKRDKVPWVRLCRLVEIFGPESQCKRYLDWIESLELGEGPPLARPKLMSAGKARAARPEVASTETEQRITRLLAVLFQIPEHRRAAALSAATEVLLDHLPPPPTSAPALPGQP